jgi:hypothetical protein
MFNPAFRVFNYSDFSLFSAVVDVHMIDPALKISLICFFCHLHRIFGRSRFLSELWEVSLSLRKHIKDKSPLLHK